MAVFGTADSEIVAVSGPLFDGAHRSRLRVGEHDLGDRAGSRLRAPHRGCWQRRSLPWYLPDVRERPHAGDVSDRPESIAGTHRGIDADSMPPSTSAPTDSRPKSRLFAAGDRSRPQPLPIQLLAVQELHQEPVPLAMDACGALTEMDPQPLSGQSVGQCVAERARFARKDVIHPLDQVHSRSKARKRLSQLDADRASAEDHEALRDLASPGGLALVHTLSRESRPGIGGITGSDPVATTICEASYRMP